MAYGFYNARWDRLGSETQQQIRVFIKRAEDAWGIQFPEGRNPNASFMRHLWEPLRRVCSPLQQSSYWLACFWRAGHACSACTDPQCLVPGRRLMLPVVQGLSSGCRITIFALSAAVGGIVLLVDASPGDRGQRARQQQSGERPSVPAQGLPATAHHGAAHGTGAALLSGCHVASGALSTPCPCRSPHLQVMHTALGSRCARRDPIMAPKPCRIRCKGCGLMPCDLHVWRAMWPALLLRIPAQRRGDCHRRATGAARRATSTSS